MNLFKPGQQSCQGAPSSTIPARTIGVLVLLIVRLRYEQSLNDRVRQTIIRAVRKHGLLSEIEEDSPYRGHPRGPRSTPKYFALVNDDAEKLAREFTGQRSQAAGLCACGCGRMPRRGRKFATIECLKRFRHTPKYGGGRQCACGCGNPVPSWKKWFSPGCRQRSYRQQSVTLPESRETT